MCDPSACPGGSDLGGLLALAFAMLAVAFALAWVDLRLAVRRMTTVTTPPPGDLQPAVAAYLDELDAALELPATVRNDIRAELATHIADSVAALEEEGIDPDASVRETLARLGHAKPLADDIALAHRSTRRLLAGAAGGVFLVGRSLAEGFAALAFGAAALAAAAGQRQFLADRFGVAIDDHGLALDSAAGLAVVAAVAFVAGRRAVGRTAIATRRRADGVRRAWAAAGTAGIALTLLFVLPIRQNWLLVPFEMAIPIAFAAGCLLRPNRPRLRVRLATFIAVPLVLCFALASFAYATGRPLVVASDAQILFAPAVAGYDRVAPQWVEQTQPIDSADASVHAFNRPCMSVDAAGSGRRIRANVQTCSQFSYRVSTGAGTTVWAWIASPDGPPSLADPGWSPASVITETATFDDLQYELWRAEPVPGARGWSALQIPAREPSAFAKGSLGEGGALNLDISRSRTDAWLLFLTGVAPDGVRYRIGDPIPIGAPFQGTLWSWLTAGA